MSKGEPKTYRAIVWQRDTDAPGQRITLHAPSPADARRELAARFGERIVYTLVNEPDADRPRGLEPARPEDFRVDMGWERVHTMTDYYDGPRGGIADLDARPVRYESIFDEARGYTEAFALRAVDAETLRLALEDWQIWLRWEDAYIAGRATLETHPALPEDRRRHDVISPVLERRLAGLPGPVIHATAEFRTAPGKPHGGRGRWLEVRWRVAR